MRLAPTERVFLNIRVSRDVEGSSQEMKKELQKKMAARSSPGMVAAGLERANRLLAVSRS